MARFRVLSDIDPDLKSVLDIGCGLSELYQYLRNRGFGGTYHGVDIVPEFVKHSKDRFKDDPKATASLSADTYPTGYNYALLSGVFNNAMDDNWGFMKSTLRKMYAAADKGIAFDAMTSHVDYHDPGLFYVDPMQVFQFCKTELGGNPVLRHDYTLREGGFPFEFAIYVYKTPSYQGF